MNIGHKIRLKRTSTSFWKSNLYIYMYLRNKRYQDILAAAKLKRTLSVYSWHLMPPCCDMFSDKQLKKIHICAKVHQGLDPVDMIRHCRQLASEGAHRSDCASADIYLHEGTFGGGWLTKYRLSDDS